MRILIFDPFSGAAGDMVIGSLIHLGADEGLVIRVMESVVGTPVITRVARCGIQAVRVETRAGTEHRTLEEVLARIDSSSASNPVKEMAKRVFGRIDRAETVVHGTKTHFHEVGADDAIADVLGACTAFYSLQVNGVSIRPIRVGRGMVSGAHGIFPVPAPASVEILKESMLPVQFVDEDRELCTPTGAALLAEFASFASSPAEQGRIVAVGYGAGTENPVHMPNVLRSFLIASDEGRDGDIVDILETNVDDVTGEVLSSTLSALLDAGARDACAIPLLMKKGRSGHLVRIITSPEDSKRLAEHMAKDLGTLGIRCIPSVHRFTARRTAEPVSLNIGGKKYSIVIKIGWLGQEPFSVKAEYEQVLSCAGDTGLPPRDIKRIAEETWWRINNTRNTG